MRDMKRSLVVVLVMAAAVSISAQSGPESPAPRYEVKSYHTTGLLTEGKYDLFVSAKYRKGTPAPLIVALHGNGSNPYEVMHYQGLIDLADERGYLLAAPMGFNDHGGYGMRRTAPDDPDEPPNLGELSELDVMNVLEAVRKEYTVDPQRIYLMGHSMGGGGTWYLGMKYPDIWAALAPASPSTPFSRERLAQIRQMPVIVVQGDSDPLIKVENTRMWVAKMKELGMRYEYIEVPFGGHTDVIMRSPENLKKIVDFFDKARKK